MLPDYLYGLSNLSDANFMQSASPGGEPGVSTGFGAGVLFRLDKFSFPAAQFLSGRYTTAGGAAGWLLYISILGQCTFFVINGAGASVSPISFVFTASDVGKIFHLAGVHSGAGATVTSYMNGSATLATPTTNPLAITGYTPATTTPTILGRGVAAGASATSVTVLGEFAFQGVPSAAQMLQHAFVSRTLLDIPDTIGGATVTHLRSLKRELAGVLNPAGRKTYGARAFAASANLITATGKGLRGNASGMSFWAVVRQDQLTFNGDYFGTSNTGITQGWTLANNTGGSFFYVANNGGVNAPTVARVFNAGDLGVPQLVVGVHTGSVIRLFWGSRTQTGADAAAVGYTPSAAAMVLGLRGTLLPNVGASVFGLAGSDGVVLSQSDVNALFDEFDRTGNLPAGGQHVWDISAQSATSVPATITDTGSAADGTHNLSRTGTIEQAIAIATGPACPVQLTDQITKASADALARNGSPVVKLSDPTIDGRRQLGAMGFSDANYLNVQGGGLLGSATGFTHTFRVRWDAVPTGNQVLAIAADGVSTVWYLRTAGAVLTFTVGSSSNSYTITAADVGQWITIQTQFTITQARLFVRGVQIGADAASGFPVVASPFFRLGSYPSQAFVSGAIAGACGGNYVATLAELQQQAADIESAGKLVAIPGLNGGSPKTQHLWDLTTDVIASGVDAVPATVLDRIGTDNLSRVGIDVHTDANAIRGIGPYGLADGWQTVPGGGIQGAAGGFHAVADVWWIKVPTSTEGVLTCLNSGNTAGWYLQVVSGVLRLVVVATSAAISGTYTITSADLNKRTRIEVKMTAAKVVQLFVNGVQAGSNTTQATTYVAPGVAMLVGNGGTGNTQPMLSGYVEAVAGGNVPSSAGDTATYAADLTQTIPTIASVTQKKWTLETDVAAASGALPSRSVERISGGDDMIRLGSPLTLAQKTDRLFSWETSPIMKSGATSSGNRWESAASLANGGDPVSFFVAPLVRVVGSSSGRFLANSNGGSAGWTWFASGGTLIQFSINDGAGASKTAPTFTVANDGKIRPLFGAWSMPSAVVSSFANKTYLGGTGCTGYNMTNLGLLGLSIGSFFGGSGGNPSIEVLGLVMGYGLPTVAEIRAWEDACLASEDIAAIGGNKSAHMYSFKRGLSGTTLLDLVGSTNLPMVGAPTVSDIYSRAFAA